jgi:ankyrin repeat protein
LSSLTSHLEIVSYLIEKGADVHVNNDSPLQWSAGKGHLEIAKYLISQGANIHALRASIEAGYLDVVRYLLGMGKHWYIDEELQKINN